MKRPADLHQALEEVRARCPAEGKAAADPILFPARFPEAPDAEVAGFLASALAYGRRDSFLHTLETVFRSLGPSPAAAARGFDPARDGRPLFPLRYRFNTGADLALLVAALGEALQASGSLERHFARYDRPGEADCAAAVQGALGDLRERVRRLATRLPADAPVGGPLFLLPDPDGGSPLKRVFLFLRWMVRRQPPDFGLWRSFDPARLLIPLDVHLFRLGRRLGLTRHGQAGLAAARDITAAFRRLSPADPLRWDFALSWWGGAVCRNGNGPCPPESRAACPLAPACRTAPAGAPGQKR